ncbi:MAG: RHS repeat-associated core domain-containing protein [Pseudonocardia sp.]|nr:RHS repeat-associated core domain-containing protein [Pseudonocardia sp.]
MGLTDPSGTLVDTYSYDPYGTNTYSTGTVPNPYRYAGGFQDPQTGLYHFGARYYDSTTGRWTQRDPSGRDANAYAYVGGDPVNRVDPNGTFSWKDAAGIVLGSLGGTAIGAAIGLEFGPVMGGIAVGCVGTALDQAITKDKITDTVVGCILGGAAGAIAGKLPDLIRIISDALG